MTKFQNLSEVISHFQELSGMTGCDARDANWSYSQFCRHFSEEDHDYYYFPVPITHGDLVEITGWGWDISISDQRIFISAIGQADGYPVWVFPASPGLDTLLLMMSGVQTWHFMNSSMTVCQCGRTNYNDSHEPI